MPPVSQGVPVISSRQWTTGLSPNAAGDGWNYIAMSYSLHDTRPVEWVVLKDLTGVPSAPSQAIYETLTSVYANTLYSTKAQLRSANGQIWFPMYHLYTCYYDPTDEQVHQIGPVVEDPPIGAHTSTIFYQAAFDTAGQLYFSTQESENRPSCIVHTDPNTLAQTVLGYVGDGALSYTTYGYRIAADTGTAQKYVYVSYGQNPWQLWALNITTGVATKLYPDLPSNGFISFTDIAGKGWRVSLDDGATIVQKWCIDGALYDYVPGEDPPNPRNVTPYSNPLAGAPSLDTTGGIGVVGWRDGTSGPYTYVNYTVNYATPVAVESLVNVSTGVLGNAQQYQGFFRYDQTNDDHTWFGPWAGGLSGGPRLTVTFAGSTATYLAGYPNGVLYTYDASQDWQTNVNPALLGNYGPQGTQLAAIKYADYLAWSVAAGRLYCAGSRERNGTGAGIGLWDKATATFAGTHDGLDSVLPTGLVALDGISRIVMATRLITPPGTAPLIIYDHDLNQISADVVIDGLANLGQIFPTSDPDVICGIVQGSGNSLGLYQYDVTTQALVAYTEVAIIGTLGPMCLHPGGAVWVTIGNALARVDVNALSAVVEDDLTGIAPVSALSFAGDAHTLFMAAGSPDGVSGAEMFTLDVGGVLAAEAGVGRGVGFDATLLADGSITLVADPGHGTGIGNPASLNLDISIPGKIGAFSVVLENNESAAIVLCQPVYSDTSGAVRLAVADGSSRAIVIGLVEQESIGPAELGRFALDGVLEASTDAWDAICGTTGGLAQNTTYYLDPVVPGRLTPTAPSLPGQEVVAVLRSLSRTRATLVIQPPIKL